MQHIVCALAILLLLGLAPKRHREKPAEKMTLIKEMKKLQEKEADKPEEDDCSGNDFSVYWSVIDINSL
jgi:hypothetical protein